MKKLFEYSVNDAVITKKLADIFLPREYEIAKLVRVPLFDAARMTYGQLVESYLMWNSYERNELFPNRPGFDTKEARASEGMYEGAYVKEPEKGMHENVALFDFRSLYPTIIISHNIDPSTLDCDCCKGKSEKVADTEHWFCTKNKGLMPSVLDEIIKRRVSVKEKMKKVKKDSLEYKKLDNEQYALKILANSAYGYLAYRGARWYSRESASSVTALGRMYIKNIIKMAEKFGLKAIYGDTDSLFVIAEKGSIKDKAGKFQNAVNKELPGVMQLEFEGIYKRGIFVTKKRYALADDSGKTLIKGLEFVRKDWSPLAKETQKKVLDALLRDGKPEKAFEIIRETIKRIQNKDVTLEDLAVYTDLTRPLEKYEVTAPHVAAAHRLKQKGKDIHTGSTIGYIIVKGGGKISERSMPVEYVKFENYDPKYYIEHQIIPAVSRVMEALGYEEEDLLGRKQVKLGEYFK
jgi:DNA polymerase Pol2